MAENARKGHIKQRAMYADYPAEMQRRSKLRKKKVKLDEVKKVTSIT